MATLTIGSSKLNMTVAAARTAKVPHPSALSLPQQKITKLESHAEFQTEVLHGSCVPILQLVVTSRHGTGKSLKWRWSLGLYTNPRHMALCQTKQTSSQLQGAVAWRGPAVQPGYMMESLGLLDPHFYLPPLNSYSRSHSTLPEVRSVEDPGGAALTHCSSLPDDTTTHRSEQQLQGSSHAAGPVTRRW